MRLVSGIAVAAFLVSSSAAHAQNVARMEGLLKYWVDAGFMGAVLVARDDQVLLSKGYGLANVEWDVPATPSTRFRIASITKQFTAAAILLLEERRRLSAGPRPRALARGARGVERHHDLPPAHAYRRYS